MTCPCTSDKGIVPQAAPWIQGDIDQQCALLHRHVKQLKDTRAILTDHCPPEVLQATKAGNFPGQVLSGQARSTFSYDTACW